LAVGTCPNVERCSKAASGGLIELYPGFGEVCPECGRRLVPQQGAAAPNAELAQERAVARPATIIRSSAIDSAIAPSASIVATPPPAPPPPAQTITGTTSEPIVRQSAPPLLEFVPEAPAQGWQRPIVWGAALGVAVLAIVGAVFLVPRVSAPAAADVRLCAAGGAAERLAPDLIRNFRSKYQGAPISLATRDCQITLGEGKSPPGKSGTIDQMIALDGVVVVVNAANPVQKLTLSQVADIFTGKTSNWSDLGGPNAAITVVRPPQDSAETALFRRVVLGGAAITSSARHLDSIGAVTATVGHDHNAIGIASFAASDPAVAVRLTTDDGTPIAASTLAIGQKRYPLSIPVFISHRADASNPLVDQFTSFVLSDAGRTIVGNDGFVSGTSF